MGSVKETVKVRGRSLLRGYPVGEFRFSDDYSAFDWGKMPQQIPQKGHMLTLMAAANFEMLEEHGLRTHYLGLTIDGDTYTTDKIGQNIGLVTNQMRIRLAKVIKPGFVEGENRYDYSAYRGEDRYVIPLEIIFRNSLPESSSVWRRLDDGSLKPEDMGLSRRPEPGHAFKPAWIDFSTKYEEQAGDRYLSRAEAEAISNLTPIQFLSLVSQAQRINDLLSAKAAEAGLVHEDGKVEAVYWPSMLSMTNPIMWADVVGTLDEDKFTHQGIPLSKELLRDPYRIEHPGWVADVMTAKKLAKRFGREDWKPLCLEGIADDVERKGGPEKFEEGHWKEYARKPYIGINNPPELDNEWITLASQAYVGGVRAYTGLPVFASHFLEVPKLEAVLDRYHERIEQAKRQRG
ncbi:phosphoribosylaminoimidazolesuccinocarboxamide synthase [Candidatus Woesearchaeota archaeon]|nr:phosphoribosylaminoimidazolesuccinocarboxamide synthase [Candidatus Woesearchaeota archaeon]